MITGKFADVAKFKGPILRGLSARAPYFHNGSAQTLMDVVYFYNFAIPDRRSDYARKIVALWRNSGSTPTRD